MNEIVKLAIEKGEYKHAILIDKQDESMVGKHKWHLTPNGYAVTWIDGKRVRMHHLIMGRPPIGLETDHINRNRLDNRRKNLRFVSSLVNGQNTTAIGVRKHGKLWEANVCLNYKKVYKGFKTKSAALKWRQSIKKEFVKTL